jgi:peptide/nickel transport system permease protein
LKHDRRFVAFTFAVLALHTLVLLADFIAPYDPAGQNRDQSFVAPTRLHFQDDAGHWHIWPFVYALVPAEDGSLKEDRSRPYPVQMFKSGDEYELAGLIRLRLHLFGVEAPARINLFGTDAFGRDQFSRWTVGAQVSLLAGILATCLSLTLGAVVGLVSGFYGGWIDALLSRSGDLFMALPWLYLLFAARAFLPLDVSAAQAWIVTVGIIGVVGWARPARLVRGIALSARVRNYVLAARGFGASDAYLVRRHILPLTWTLLLTQATVLIPQYVLAEVALSFVGLGIGEPTPSWGNMLAPLQQYHVIASYPWMFIPVGLLILIFHGYFGVSHVLHEKLKSTAT